MPRRLLPLLDAGLAAAALLVILGSGALAQEATRGHWRGTPEIRRANADRPTPHAQRTRQRRNRRDARRREEIERTIEVLELEPGEVIAEIGAGDGRFSLRFAEVVGAEGRVYANELDSDDVERIGDRAEEMGLDNLTTVQGAVDDTNLPDACCDAMMMRMVYHMLTDPVPMSQSFYRALKPGGRLVILDGDPEPGEPNAKGVPANRAGMGIDPQIVIDELAELGFAFDRLIEDWVGADYALVFHKPGSGR